MGLLRDALDLGYITLDQYEEMATYWSNWGYDARHYGDVEQLQKMTEDFLTLGFADLAEAAATEMLASVDYYAEASGYTINYSVTSERWYDTTTGRFVCDPYEWIRD